MTLSLAKQSECTVLAVMLSLAACTSPPSAAPIECGEAPEQEGEGTYYDADGSGNCTFPPSPGDLMVAAMNDGQYEGSAVCGICAHVTGPLGEVTVRIVDRCPECAPGDLDLSPQAFDRIAEHAHGRVPIRWREVPCEVASPIVYHFKDGSNPWWAAIQIRNHRNRVVRLEVLDDDGRATELPRVDYNYFLAESGLGEGPYRLRVTDVYGSTIEDEGVPLLDDGDHPSSQQFPACAP